MKKMTDPERVKKAIEERDPAELEWALGYAQSRAAESSDETIRKYWDEIIRRIEGR